MIDASFVVTAPHTGEGEVPLEKVTLYWTQPYSAFIGTTEIERTMDDE